MKWGTMRALLALLFLVVTSPARAQDVGEIPARVEVVLPRCEGGAAPPWGPAFLELLQIELGEDGVDDVRALEEDASATGEHVARITLLLEESGACEGARITITIDDVLTQKRVSRAFDLSDVVASVRPRALSIFATELLRASWAELILPQRAHLPLAPPASILGAIRARARTDDDERPPAMAARAAPATLEPFPALSGEASASVRAFPGASSALLGGELAVVLRLGDLPLVLRLDAGLAAGETVDRLGRILLGLGGGGLTAGAGARWQALTLDVGARLGVGAGWSSGTATEPGVAASEGIYPVVTASLASTLRARLGAGISALIGVELGAPILGIEALVDGVAVAGIRGPMLALRLGLSID